MRLWKRRGVLTEVLTRLLGWQKAVSQAEGLSVGKELCLACWQPGDGQNHFNPHSSFGDERTDRTQTRPSSTPLISCVHLDAQWEQCTKTEMLAGWREKWGQLCFYSATPLFSSPPLLSPLFFPVSAPVNIDSALGRLDCKCWGPLGLAPKISTFTGDRSMAWASAIVCGHSRPKTCYHCMCSNGGTGEREALHHRDKPGDLLGTHCLRTGQQPEGVIEGQV